ncbi:MAG: DUF4418 family protein [Coriobacteriia bacterium]
MALKVLGVALVVVALLAAVIPFFNNCTAEGLYITTKDGRQIDMKCFWTSRASIGVAIPLAAVGILLFLSRRAESGRFLGVIGILLSAVLFGLPTVLIGVCQMDKTCLNVMKPSLMILGVIGVVLSVAAIWFAGRGVDEGHMAA